MQRREKLARLLEGAYAAQALLGVAGVALLILLQIPWLSTVATKIGLEDTDQFRTAVIGLVLIAILSQLRDLYEVMTARTESGQHFTDPRDMYDAMLASAEATTDPNSKRLDVLALTLYSAWPTLSFWLQRPEAAGWQLRLATLAATAESEWIPTDWPAESAANAAAAIHFGERPGVLRRGISISVSTYDFTPAIHGFRLGNGDIYISNVLWDHDGLIGKHGFSYQFISHTDAGAAGEAYRALFDNWFTRAIGEPIAEPVA